jgi:hypothetical protein
LLGHYFHTALARFGQAPVTAAAKVLTLADVLRRA